jgi:PST family polysaccharide transporter/lipopolysaccharide exporter
VSAVILEKSVLLILIFISVLRDLGLAGIGIAYLCAGLMRLTFVSLLLIRRDSLTFDRPRLSDSRAVVRGGIPFAFSTVALNVIPRLDTVLIASFSTIAAGYFALGDRMLGPAWIIPVVASTALYPFFSAESAEAASAWNISALMLIVGTLAAVTGFVLAPIIVPGIFGEEYRPAVSVVRIMVFVLPFLYASNPLLARLYTSGKERRVFFVTLFASILGTVFILIGQSTVGAVGAAVGYVLRHVLFTASLGALMLLKRPPIRTQPGDLESSQASLPGETTQIDS